MESEEVWGPILRDVSLDRDVTFTPENEEKIKSIKNFLTANFPNKEYPWKSLLEVQQSIYNKHETVGMSAENMFAIRRLNEDEYWLSQTQLQPSLGSQGTFSQQHLTAELLDSVLPLKLALDSLKDKPDAVTFELPSTSITAFINCSPELLESLCMELDIPDLSNMALAILCDEILQPKREISFRWCTGFVHCCFLKRVSELQARAPRILLQTIANVTSKYPSATVEGLMVACVFSGSLQHPQSELLAHLFTSCLSAEHQTQFLTIVLSKTFDWNDSMVDLLTSILETQYVLTSEILNLLTSRLVDSTTQMDDSLKLCKVIRKLIQKISGQITIKNREDLKLVLDRNKSFLKKACLTSLMKCSS